jgi:hypothetical protein
MLENRMDIKDSSGEMANEKIVLAAFRGFSGEKLSR